MEALRGKVMEASLRNNPFLGLWSKACSSASVIEWIELNTYSM